MKVPGTVASTVNGGAVTKDDSTPVPLSLCYFSTIFALKLLYLNKKYWQIMLDTVSKVIYNKLSEEERIYMKIYNTLSRTIEDFKPIDENL
ncbi:MAG TPA: hypothetical protein PLD67_02185, partial [Sedimentibacter sp.]|nr:hypothetical protein [Sedimentibacter sp.]